MDGSLYDECSFDQDMEDIMQLSDGSDGEQNEQDLSGEPISTSYVQRKSPLALMSDPQSIRNVAIVGHFQHGKTLLMDLLVEMTHPRLSTYNDSSAKHMRFTDTRMDEQSKRISIKAMPMSLVLEDSNSKSFLCNLMDSPGHVDFSDEMTASLRLADGAILVIDAAEGVMLNTKRAIHHAMEKRITIVVVINKVDRLIDELQLSPNDAYDKLKIIVDMLNEFISSTKVPGPRMDPTVGNVCFASATAGWSFTLLSIAKLYLERHADSPFDVTTFVSNIWGDMYYHPNTRTFKGEPPTGGGDRSFVQFVLKPLYKVYNQEREKAALEQRDVRAQLKLACCSTFGSTTGFTDMLVQHIPSAMEAARAKVEHIYTGPRDSPMFKSMVHCDPMGPLMVNVTKFYPKDVQSGPSFDAFGRIYSGEIRQGDKVNVLYKESKEKITKLTLTVSNLWIFQARYRIPVRKAPAGTWVLIEGINCAFWPEVTICQVNDEKQLFTFRKLHLNTMAVARFVVQPLFHNEIYELKTLMGYISKTYHTATSSSVFEFKRICIDCTGELSFTCIKTDLEEMYGMEIELLDTFSCLGETVKFRSFPCTASTMRNNFKISMMAKKFRPPKDPERKNPKPILNGVVSLGGFQHTKAYTTLSLDEKVFGKVEHLLESAKECILRGFNWLIKRGPLCHEPIRFVKFVIMDALIDPTTYLDEFTESEIHLTIRSVVKSAFVMGSPTLMEPIYFVEIQTAPANAPTIREEIVRRRGRVLVSRELLNRTVIEGFVPVIESFRLQEELLKIQTRGMSQMIFDHWDIVPGLILEKSIKLHQQQAPENLAWRYLVKMRLIKGIGEMDLRPELFTDDTYVMVELAEYAEKG